MATEATVGTAIGQRGLFKDEAKAGGGQEALAYLALEVCGYTGSAVADLLGVRPSAVYRAAQRGRTAHSRRDGKEY